MIKVSQQLTQFHQLRPMLLHWEQYRQEEDQEGYHKSCRIKKKRESTNEEGKNRMSVKTSTR
jgi:hypothetical protein